MIGADELHKHGFDGTGVTVAVARPFGAAETSEIQERQARARHVLACKSGAPRKRRWLR